MSSQYVQCLVPSLAGGDVVTDESSLSSTAEAEAEEEEETVAPFPSLVAVHDDHLSASPGGEFNNFDLLRLMAGDTAGVSLTRSGINSRNNPQFIARLAQYTGWGIWSGIWVGLTMVQDVPQYCPAV